MSAERYAIGIDLGGTYIKAAVVTETGMVLDERQVETPAGRQREAVAEKMGTLLTKLLQKHPEAVGIGIGSPGLVDAERNMIRESPNFPGWKNVPLRLMIAERVKRPVFLENDVNCFGLAEHRWGAGQGSQFMLALALGTGVGGAVIINGQLYRGSSGAAGELGHISVDMQGPQCPCGNYGCIERYLGNKWFVAAAQVELTDKSVTSPEEITRRAESGDAAAIRFLEGRGEILGAACTSLMNIFDPEVIVIGGGLAQSGEPLFRGIRKAIQERSYQSLLKEIKILPAKLGKSAGARGAAAVGLDAGETQ
ncbi:ROK family protein [bacterium]|nr:ROK family protein [bacterium]MBU1651723.1 ROK family protein [bacterium]MBU1882034.1 ROK family protein [bacterium]